MRLGQRRQPAEEGVNPLALAQGLAGHGLHRRQRVPHPVVQLGHEQPLVLLGPLALGDVAGNLRVAAKLALRAV
jgi:hypothetical protein